VPAAEEGATGEEVFEQQASAAALSTTPSVVIRLEEKLTLKVSHCRG
jgi:hypothetical protein